jgi:hypothetical protein
MSLFRRGHHDSILPGGPPASPGSAVDAADTPDALRAAIVDLNRFVNSSAGRLPVSAVVSAREIADVLNEVIDTSQVRPLDVYAVQSVKGAIADYLPTTLRSFLAVDESLINAPRPSGRTPVQSLLEQLAALESSALAVLDAAQQEDVDALMTQGSFLRTKFSGSDLDL